MEHYPPMSLIIPTYNRPEDMRRVLASLTTLEYPEWDVLVVDQSDDDRTQGIVEGIRHRLPNLHYRRLSEKGCSLGRNVGMRETEGEIIAFLDDDCTVGPDWLTQAAHAFGRHPRAELVVGELRRFDDLGEWAENGWIPVRHYGKEFEVGVADGLRVRLRIWGNLMGNAACMFVRRSLVKRIGFFDLQMGGGCRFPANEDGDFQYRALMAGCRMVGTPAIVAHHYGLRDYQSGAASRLLQAYEYSIGAWFMKVVRLGDPAAVVWTLTEFPKFLRIVRPRNILTRRGPTGLAAASAFVHGLVIASHFRLTAKASSLLRGQVINRLSCPNRADAGRWNQDRLFIDMNYILEAAGVAETARPVTCACGCRSAPADRATLAFDVALLATRSIGKVHMHVVKNNPEQ